MQAIQTDVFTEGRLSVQQQRVLAANSEAGLRVPPPDRAAALDDRHSRSDRECRVWNPVWAMFWIDRGPTAG